MIRARSSKTVLRIGLSAMRRISWWPCRASYRLMGVLYSRTVGRGNYEPMMTQQKWRGWRSFHPKAKPEWWVSPRMGYRIIGVIGPWYSTRQGFTDIRNMRRWRGCRLYGGKGVPT